MPMDGVTSRANNSCAARWCSRSSGVVEVWSVALCTALMARIIGPRSSAFCPCWGISVLMTASNRRDRSFFFGMENSPYRRASSRTHRVRSSGGWAAGRQQSRWTFSSGGKLPFLA